MSGRYVRHFATLFAVDVGRQHDDPCRRTDAIALRGVEYRDREGTVGHRKKLLERRIVYDPAHHRAGRIDKTSIRCLARAAQGFLGDRTQVCGAWIVAEAGMYAARHLDRLGLSRRLKQLRRPIVGRLGNRPALTAHATFGDLLVMAAAAPSVGREVSLPPWMVHRQDRTVPALVVLARTLAIMVGKIAEVGEEVLLTLDLDPGRCGLSHPHVRVEDGLEPTLADDDRFLASGQLDIVDQAPPPGALQLGQDVGFPALKGPPFAHRDI